jgi:hypothetical protein
MESFPFCERESELSRKPLQRLVRSEPIRRDAHDLWL